MSTSSKRYGFFDLHPGVCLAPFVAAVAFLAYVNLATLATARTSVGGPWLVSAFIGAFCGLAALPSARARAGKLLLVMIGPVILIVIGLLISKQELRLITVHAGLVTTAFQTGTLAFTGVMATGLVAGLCWVYARLLSRPVPRTGRRTGSPPPACTSPGPRTGRPRPTTPSTGARGRSSPATTRPCPAMTSTATGRGRTTSPG